VRTSAAAEDTCKRWQLRSAALGEVAKRELSEETMEWALAANHVAYVTMKTDGAESKIMENIILLRRLERKMIWNARFADTVAFYYIWRFNRMKDQGDLHILRGDLASARRYLEEARGWNIGDIAVPEHESELERAELELEQLREGASENL
jgi:hypothetical protein